MSLIEWQRLVGIADRAAGGRGRHRAVGTRCSAAPRLETSVRRAKSKHDLLDPAQIGAKGTASAKFQILPSYESLQSYMLLPVEQYFVLDAKQISHLGGSRFLLNVPRINFFNIWLEAVVEVSVTTYPGAGGSGGHGNGGGPRVVLQAENCRISGSQAVESLRLDQRFAMCFVTELTWSATPVVSTASVATSAAGELASKEVAAGQATGSRKVGSATAAASVATALATSAVATTFAEVMNGEIRASSKLDVWSEVVPPFHLLPREVLVATCNGVLRGLVSSLLPLFVRLLAQDYQRWAKDPVYRAERAARVMAL